MFALLAQAPGHLRCAAQAQEGHLIDPRDQGVQVAEVRQQYRSGFGADAADPGDVVDRITGQRQVIGDLVRVHAVPGLDAIGSPALAATEIVLFVVFAQQLRQVLVGRHHHAAEALRTDRVQRAADQVVGFVLAVPQRMQP